MFHSSIKILPTKRFNESNTKINTKLINLITISIKDKRKSIREEGMAYNGRTRIKSKMVGGCCGDSGGPKEGVAAVGQPAAVRAHARGLLCCWEETTQPAARGCSWGANGPVLPAASQGREETAVLWRL